MTTINLLPRLHTLPLQGIIILTLSLVIAISLHVHYEHLIAEKQRQIVLLMQVIHTMENKSVQKQHIALKKYPPIQLYTLIQQLPTTIPVGLYLTQFSSTKGGIKVIGYTENIPLLSLWISNLTKYHFNILLQSVQHDQNNPYFPVKFYIWIKL